MRPAQQSPWISTGLVPMTPCGNIGHGHHHKPQLQQEHGPRYALSSILGQISTWARWQHRPPRSVWPRWQQDTGTPIWSKVAVQTLGICWAPTGNRSHGQTCTQILTPAQRTSEPHVVAKPSDTNKIILSWPQVAAQVTLVIMAMAAE